MFNFFMMAGNYEDRKIDRYEDGELTISTAEVYDSEAPYETAVKYPNYNGGKFVIVANYYSREDAEAGHQKWVEIMTNPVLPESLRDVSMAGIAQLLDEFDNWRDFDEELYDED